MMFHTSAFVLALGNQAGQISLFIFLLCRILKGSNKESPLQSALLTL